MHRQPRTVEIWREADCGGNVGGNRSSYDRVSL